MTIGVVCHPDQDPGYQLPAPGSLSPGIYYWRVRASNDCGWSAWSEKWWFTVLPPPAVPVLSSPMDGSSTYESKPTFQWLLVAGATEYRVRVVEVKYGTVMFSEKTTKTNHTSDVYLPPATYYWRVRAYNAWGESEWSVRRSVILLPTGLEYDVYLPLVLRGPGI